MPRTRCINQQRWCCDQHCHWLLARRDPCGSCMVISPPTLHSTTLRWLSSSRQGSKLDCIAVLSCVFILQPSPCRNMATLLTTGSRFLPTPGARALLASLYLRSRLHPGLCFHLVSTFL